MCSPPALVLSKLLLGVSFCLNSMESSVVVMVRTVSYSSSHTKAVVLGSVGICLRWCWLPLCLPAPAPDRLPCYSSHAHPAAQAEPLPRGGAHAMVPQNALCHRAECKLISSETTSLFVLSSPSYRFLLLITCGRISPNLCF